METILPVPPDEREVTLYVKPNKAFLYGFGVTSTLLLLIGGLFFSFSHASFHFYLAFVLYNAFYLSISYLLGFMARPFSMARHFDYMRYGIAMSRSVDVFLPTAGEELAVLENVYKNVALLQHKGPLRVYVLDDARRPEVKALADKYRFDFIIRPTSELKKAGNLRNAFKLTRGEFILILDADFAPRSDFLMHTLPYMLDKKTAIVQTSQFFRVNADDNWLRKGASSVQELFYRLIQVNRNSFGAAICVGTNALYRRSALEPFGGSYPIEHSEDLHTGYNLITHGWDLVYLPLNLAAGLSPDSVSSFLKQQYRWCSGSTSLFLNRRLFWGHKLGLMKRLSYLSGMLYYQATALGVLLTPLPGLAMVLFFPERVFWYNAIFSLPSLLFGTLHMKAWNKLPYGLFTLRTRLLSYYAHLFALWDIATGSVMEWHATGVNKKSRIERYAWFMYVWVWGPPLVGLTAAGVKMGRWDNYDFYPYILVTAFYFWLNAGALKIKRA